MKCSSVNIVKKRSLERNISDSTNVEFTPRRKKGPRRKPHSSALNVPKRSTWNRICRCTWESMPSEKVDAIGVICATSPSVSCLVLENTRKVMWGKLYMNVQNVTKHLPSLISWMNINCLIDSVLPLLQYQAPWGKIPLFACYCIIYYSMYHALMIVLSTWSFQFGVTFGYVPSVYLWIVKPYVVIFPMGPIKPCICSTPDIIFGSFKEYCRAEVYYLRILVYRYQHVKCLWTEQKLGHKIFLPKFELNNMI